MSNYLKRISRSLQLLQEADERMRRLQRKRRQQGIVDPEEEETEYRRTGSPLPTEIIGRVAKYPCTVRQYLHFCRVTGYEVPDPPAWGHIKDHPIVKVSAYDTEAYCEFARLRLPTEAEWVQAATGGNDWIYPWGNEEPDDETGPLLLNCHPYGPKRTTPVGSYPEGASPSGHLDMSGNVWERTAATRDSARRSGVRGGSWSNTAYGCQLHERLMLLRDTRLAFTGFRPAR